MIYFITNRNHPVYHPDITIVDNFNLFHEFMSTATEVCLDKEFNGLNEFYAIPLLTQLGNEDVQFVIDDTAFSPETYFKEEYRTKLFIGHNVKIDHKILRRQGVEVRNLYDTMITEQRLGLGSGRMNNLPATYQRRTGKLMMEKKVFQKDFAAMKAADLFETNQILYSALDIAVLPVIKQIQSRLIESYNMNFLINEIENPLIPIIADGELEGLNINEPAWKANIEDNKHKLIKIEKELDNLLVCSGYISEFKHERRFVEIVQGSLFTDLIEEKTVKSPQKSQINYGSKDQVLPIFDFYSLPRPTEMKKQVDKITGVKTYDEKESASEKAIQKFLIEHPGTILQDFLEKLMEQREIVKELSSFGEKFLQFRVLKPNSKMYEIGYKNRITGRVHTYYKQCEADTGRLASGESKIGFYNSQQIPALPKYRTAFTLSEQEIADGWEIESVDLAGAETVLMCAFAKDEQLYKWAIEEDDIHSPLCTRCWQAVYRHRKQTGRDLKVTSLARDKYTNEYPTVTLSEDFIVTKKINEPYRRYFKNNTFAMVYGAKPPMIAKTMNISVKEGEIMFNVIKEAIPKTFAMVEAASSFALANRYVVHNTRTNSRRWFFPYQDVLTKSQIGIIQGGARNTRIQGTQADAVKEAMIEIYKEFKRLNIPNCFLLQVHDELVWKFKGPEGRGIVQRIMESTATKYLEGFTVMKAETSRGTTWIK